MKRVLLGLSFAVLLSLPVLVRSVLAADFPKPVGFINDFAGVLTSDERSTLEQTLSDYAKKTTNEISVVIISDLGGDTIENYAVKLEEAWKIGKKGKDNGILFLVAIKDKKLRLEVGYGLEPRLTDSQAGDIIRTVVAPAFKKGDYYLGIRSGVLAIENQLDGDGANAGGVQKAKTSGGDLGNTIFWLGMLLWFIGSVAVYLASFMARTKSIWLGGVVGAVIGIIVGLVIGGVVVMLLTSVALGVFGLILDWWLSRNYTNLKKIGKKTDWWTTGGGFFGGGFGGGGGGGGGGGFGGFGGGNSGGGGSSGSW